MLTNSLRIKYNNNAANFIIYASIGVKRSIYRQRDNVSHVDGDAKIKEHNNYDDKLIKHLFLFTFLFDVMIRNPPTTIKSIQINSCGLLCPSIHLNRASRAMARIWIECDWIGEFVYMYLAQSIQRVFGFFFYFFAFRWCSICRKPQKLNSVICTIPEKFPCILYTEYSKNWNTLKPFKVR